MGRRSQYPVEVRERSIRLVLEQQGQHESQWAAICSIAGKVGCTPETLRKWVRQAERDAGRRPGLTTSERERLKQLERENREPPGFRTATGSAYRKALAGPALHPPEGPARLARFALLRAGIPTCAATAAPPAYAPRRRRQTVLHRVLVEHLETLIAEVRGPDGAAPGLPAYVERGSLGA